ncbi:peptidoglycan-binding protein LysM [Fodinibius salsisoli]|uniref:Peptidoglycan-binding protein LysM n=1 Tax=Fodinibius salsisoli TaxID=2820877 RepID=A0ABT3PJ10_9BACT|nr:peptidoglycan-binding protein LysM [Fodinibius salsisoli]MCW9705922.1 peptidoglycan-binding protein LysM [Fodinibius salsisoli]
MGLISFIKEAGSKVLGIGESDEEKKKKATQSVKQNISNLGLDVENLDISINGDTATISGKAADQATKEKVVLAVGNNQGIANVDDQLTVEKQEPEAQYHTVESGDTLSAIAKQFYGDAGKYPIIFEANKPMLSDPNKIYPGQKLRIPPQ